MAVSIIRGVQQVDLYVAITSSLVPDMKLDSYINPRGDDDRRSKPGKNCKELLVGKVTVASFRCEGTHFRISNISLNGKSSYVSQPMT